MGTEMPLPFIRRMTISKKEIARLRIISLVEVHGDGDALSFIRRMQILKRGIARLRIISLVEVHGDGEALPFIRESALLSFLLLHNDLSFLKFFH